MVEEIEISQDKPVGGNLIRTGAWQGAIAGCVSSVIFTALLFTPFLLFTYPIKDGFSELVENGIMLGIFIFIISIPIGLLPAIIIGSLSGSVTAILFREIKGISWNQKRVIGLGVLVSLILGLPLISFWVSSFNSRLGLNEIELGISTFFVPNFIPYSIGTGIYIGFRLYRKSIRSKSDLVEING